MKGEKITHIRSAQGINNERFSNSNKIKKKKSKKKWRRMKERITESVENVEENGQFSRGTKLPQWLYCKKLANILNLSVQPKQ